MTIPNDFMWRLSVLAVVLFPFFVGAVESPSPTEEAIKVIQAVGEEGQGNEKASLALQQLAAELHRHIDRSARRYEGRFTHCSKLAEKRYGITR